MAKTGYEQVSIEEIRQRLREEYGVVDEEFLKSTKTKLVEWLLQAERDAGKEPAEEEIDNLLNAAEEDSTQDAMQPHSEEDAEPGYGSEGWHDFVMRQFRDDELVDDAPTCDGCRRVVESVLGPISNTDINHIDGPSRDNNGTATVAVKVTVLVLNESHPLVNNFISCEEAADVNKDNCDFPYHKHAVATCASRAEGRALRKLLRLRNVIVAEEVSKKAEEEDADCEWEVDEPISDSQVSVIDMLCSRLDLNVIDFINAGRRTYDQIESVTNTTAQRMIRELNKIQRKQKPAPETVGSYNPAWRSPNDEDSSQSSP